MVINGKGIRSSIAGLYCGRRRAAKLVLLIVEIAALVGLFAGALQLWHAQQALQRDLVVAQEVEAALDAAEQAPTVIRAAEAGVSFLDSPRQWFLQAVDGWRESSDNNPHITPEQSSERGTR